MKPAGVNATEKPNIHGKSNPANAIKTPGNVRPALPSAGKTIPAKELFTKTAASMGFPKDPLSVALLVFARYLSVPINPALMKTLRQEILASGKPSSPETQAEKTALEAEALSSLIALDKGVELSPQALEQYARFFSFPDKNPDRQDKQDKEEERDPDRDHDREESPEAEELRILIGEQGQNDGVLALLNQLPGKNGQHWLVFPFDIKIKGIDFRVFLRLLKKDPGSSGENGHSHLIVDISGSKKQWRCFLKKAGEKFLADLRVYPSQSPRALKVLQKRAEQFLKSGRALFGSPKGFEEITVRNGEEAPSWADDLCPESLPSIDEQV